MERPITVDVRTNILAGTGCQAILDAYRQSLAKREAASVPELLDGKASERIWDVLSREE